MDEPRRMPRASHDRILTPRQTQDLTAPPLDPALPVNE